jgi:hypothetical protein
VAWGNRSFNINSSAQWEVQRAVDELGPYLKWSTRAELARTLKARKKEAKSFEAELTRLSADDPKILVTCPATSGRSSARMLVKSIPSHEFLEAPHGVMATRSSWTALSK